MVLRVFPVVWVDPANRISLYVLHHPFYAGAYVFGRTKRVRELDPENPRKVRIRQMTVRRDEWPVLLKDQHPDYFSASLSEGERKGLLPNGCQVACSA